MSSLSSPTNDQQASGSNSSKRPSTSSTVNLDDGESSDKATAELSQVVDELLNQLSSKFSSISEELLGKMDEMSRRLDNLEAAIQAGKSSGEK